MIPDPHVGACLPGTRYAAALMRSWTLAWFAVLAAGCAPAIGDSCQTAVDCSITGDRVCDRAQPGGSCIIFGCDEGTCPPEAACVRWRPSESDLEFNACMRRCTSNGDCRTDEGYACLNVDDPALVDRSTGLPLAELVDTDAAAFCVATMPDDAT